MTPQSFFRDLLNQYKPSVIFLQETMCLRMKAIDDMLTMRPGWHAVAVEAMGVDAVGRAGGTLAIWDP